ncbi:MAG: hypothetical protein KIT84_35885 [Labilithrix sp.]|nr:hypothetical protein [Labilithrix sp.]MCW5816435.1 hypothetical protein [Labilithrix sp.]
MNMWIRTAFLTVAATTAEATAHATEEAACTTAHVQAQVLRRDTPEKLLARRAALRTCSSALCPPSIVQACTGWLGAVAPLIPKLTVRVVDRRGTPLAAAAIKVDGMSQAPGQALELDPGEHTVIATMGTTTESRAVVVRLAETDGVLEIALPVDMVSLEAPASLPPTPETKSGVPVGTWVSYGIGAAGLATGIVFLVSERLQNASLAKTCTLDADGVPTGAQTERCPREREAEVDALTRDRILLGIGFGVAAIGLGLGSYFLVASPSSPTQTKTTSRTDVRPLIGLGWLGMGGRFQ